MSSSGFKTGFEVEQYLRSLDSDDTKKSAHAWLIKLKHICINDNIPKILQKISKTFNDRLHLFNELNPASRLKNEEAQRFENDMKSLKDTIKEEDLETFKKFEESAAVAIPYVCVQNKPVLEYKTEYLYLYYNIFMCICDFINSTIEEVLVATPIINATSCKLLIQFIKISNELVSNKGEKSIVFRISELISKNESVAFESREERDNAIIDIIKSFIVGGRGVHDKRMFMKFWNQVIARNRHYHDYIISIVNEIFLRYGADGEAINLSPIYSMDTETFADIEGNCLKKVEEENIPKARTTKLISTVLVIATAVISYMNYKSENQ
jgi:hypothetical protein